jgi:O-antigen/teichoic acid export membrane protein
MSLLARLRDIGKDSSIYGLSQVLSQLIGFLLLPLYTSYLSPADYGVLAMLSLIPLILPPVVNLGLNNAVFRYYSQCKTSDERDTLIGTAHVLTLAASSIVFASLALFSKPLSYELTDSNHYTLAFNLTLLSAWFTAISTIPMVVLKQQRKVKQVALRSLMSLLLNVAMTLLFVVYFRWGVLGSVIGNVAGSASAAILVTMVVSSRTWVAFARVKVRELLEYSLPFVPYFLQAVAMGFVGQYLIKEKVGLEDAGFYSIAVRFALPIAIFLNAVNSSWAGYKFDIRQGEADPKKTYRAIFSVYTVFVSLIWLMVSLWMPCFYDLF